MRAAAVTGVVLSIAAATTLAACGDSGGASGADKPIVLGATLSLSGQGASYGTMAKGGIDTAVDEINAAGGINGRKLQVKFEDNQLAPANAATGTQKLLGDGVKIMFTHGSSITAAVTKVTAGKDVLLANVAAQSDAVVANPQVFSFLPTNNMELGHLAELAYTKLGHKTIAVIHSDDDYGKSASGAAIAAFEQLGGKVVANESHPPGTTDMRNQLIKIQGTNPGAILVLSNTGEIGHIIKQARELKYTGDLMGADSSIQKSDTTIAGQAMEGAKGVAIRFDKTANSQAQAFDTAFQKKLGTPPNNYAAIAYTATKLLAAAMTKAGGDDPKKVAAELAGIKDQEGILGSMTFGANRVLQFPYYEWVFKDGQVTPLS